MAEVTLVAATSHSPFLYNPPEKWNETRDARPVRNDVPYDSVETNIAKFKQCMAAFDILRERVQEAKPDVLLIFGDDQDEVFHFDNFPAFGLFLGEEFEGYRTTGGRRPQPGQPPSPRDPKNWVKVKGHPELGKVLMEGLMQREFDLAFSLDLPNKERGMGHAFMRPEHYITPEFDIPVLPFSSTATSRPNPGRNAA